MIVFDLDPGAPAGIVECCEVALVLRGLFDQLGLVSVRQDVGVEGDAGVRAAEHAPTDYRATKPFARRVAELLEQRLPELVVSRMTKRLRPGRCSSTGARTTSTRPPSPSTRSARASGPRCRRR